MMQKLFRSIVSVALALNLTLVTIPAKGEETPGTPLPTGNAAQVESTEKPAEEESALAATPSHLTEIQRNSVNMLNWLALLTQEINAASNNRMYMEEVYSLIVNETYPSAVDVHTQDRLRGICDALMRYRMNDVKRQRLEYIYEQNQADVIKTSVPSSKVMLFSSQAQGLWALAGSIVFMAVDATSSYISQRSKQEMQYLRDGWGLEDEEAEVFYSLRMDAFDYMIDIVRAYDLPGSLALNEKAIDDFVRWKKETNLARRLQFFESNRETYQAFGSYYLVLAESYYQGEDFASCLQAVRDYENLNTRIFRRDREYANVLPLAIVAAEKVMDEKAYQTFVKEKAEALLNNIGSEDWALRYFAAQTFVDLYGRTEDSAYLKQAYQAALENVNYLLDEQMKQNAAYLAPVQDVAIVNGTPKKEAEEIKKYNQMLREKRKTELPPVYAPLLINCEMLFSLAERLELPDEEKTRLELLLHAGGVTLFLNPFLDYQFRFSEAPEKEADASFDGYTFTLPAWVVSDHAVITATVRNKDQEELIDGWAITRVDRKVERKLSTFRASYTSEEARNYPYEPGMTVVFTVKPYDEDCETTCRFSFSVCDAKPNWYDQIGFWNRDVYFQQVEE